MIMRFFAVNVCLGVYFFSATFSLAATESKRPNVIVLLTDDQGYADLSCHGNPALKTPHLDRLHAQSVRFTDFHAAPMCTPTRGQLLSGLDALRNGATSVTAGRACLRQGLPTMADHFAAAGYRTGLFGKWHLGDSYPYRPIDRGFQEAMYFRGWGLASAPEFDNDYFNGRYLHNGVPQKFTGYCTDFWFEEAMKWMQQRADKQEPFFLYLPTNAPHGPFWVAEKYAAPYQQKGMPAAFFGMIANLDENVGRLEEFLNKSGLRDNTILIYMTDNGGTGGVKFFNAGMRGNKTTYYEGGHRVPCFIRWPNGALRSPTDIDTPAQMQDILPTVADLCQLKLPAKTRLDGLSLAPLLRDAKQQLPDRKLVIQYGQILMKWDGCVIWNKWRLVNGEELFDLATDPAQQQNIAAKHPAIKSKLRAHYESWWNEIEPSLKTYPALTIGAAEENPVSLTCSDWKDVYCDNAHQVRSAAGGPRGGPWNLFVATDGEYEITLRRWPADKDCPLAAELPPQQLTIDKLPAGKALPIAAAQLRIAGQEKSQAIPPDAKLTTFTVTLPGQQRMQLQAWFQDAQGKDLCGAYFVEVKKR